MKEILKKNVFSDRALSTVFGRFDKHVKSFFSSPKIHSILEFPILFLGALPQNTPALYSLMNHAELTLGTWYPMGGFYKIIEALKSLCEENGVNINTSTEISNIEIKSGLASSLFANGNLISHPDVVLASADYHHVDQKLIEDKYRSYSKSYWNKRVLAPSCLIYYLGISKKIKNLEHHNLFFDESLDVHGMEIYKTPKWPTRPLFYACCPSKTDDSVAPKGQENLFLLMPVAPGLEDTSELRERYFELILNRLERITGSKISDHIVYKRSYAISDFKRDYNALKGNAYGLANTLRQTAFFKPSIRSRKVKNLFYTGQLTVPGPGVPPALISGEVASKEILKYLR